MMSEFMKEEPKMELGSLATGNIGPGPRIEAGEITKEEVDAFCKDVLSDEYFVPVSKERGPTAAAGTYSEIFAGLLRDPDFDYGHSQEDIRDHLLIFGRDAIDEFAIGGVRVGGHKDDHANHENCGCGALDKSNQIMDVIASRPKEISDLAGNLGVRDLDFSEAAERATKFAGNMPAGREILETVSQTEDSIVAELKGKHNEVVAVINMVPGSTVNKEKIAEQYGDKLEAFVVDGWALSKEALAYNIATALTLAHPSLRVVVRTEGQQFEYEQEAAVPNRCIDGRYEN